MGGENENRTCDVPETIKSGQRHSPVAGLSNIPFSVLCLAVT